MKADTGKVRRKKARASATEVSVEGSSGSEDLSLAAVIHHEPHATPCLLLSTHHSRWLPVSEVASVHQEQTARSACEAT